ncbi:hypothetical protein [uncultured Roseibium sp.]|uniref:hypothetical protein n=1 Tax=uncultured Roseibium sp. TaxID=1936171 RepID=UPI0032162BA4
MPSFKLPLSGDVLQSINPWSDMFKACGSQFGLININLGRSSAPEVERDILTEVGSYGRQIGRIGEALEVLIDHLDLKSLNPKEKAALLAFKAMQGEIAEIKSYYKKADTAA